ncbi:cytochrome oxidase complex assembly protein [Teratosphaeria nubilosa]|uniref:Cytochrome oxidase complex assembly protein n=1 Tax=Teratosphaeria nubilosa TaxID=161662 RepID=A0A6G1LGC3_9PEZI|nr:cytochrome oxidase complex assembly protein [Teratosphaeria nubilosa]
MLPPRPRLRPQSLSKPRTTPAATRTLIAAPRPNSGPLMERRADRALPTLSTSTSRWQRTLPLFALLMVASSLAIFNYQKTNSSVVSSTLYALRTSPKAREVLGDNIYFASQVPWIRGELNQLQGRIDVWFWVKGTRGRGVMRFRSLREGRAGYFETLEWSLQPEGSGEKISLLEAAGRDPFQQETADRVQVVA